MAITAYLADNGTTKAIWLDAFKGDGHECAWASDGVSRCLYLNRGTLTSRCAAKYGTSSQYAGYVLGTAWYQSSAGSTAYYNHSAYTFVGSFIGAPNLHRYGYHPSYPTSLNGDGAILLANNSNGMYCALPVFKSNQTTHASNVGYPQNTVSGGSAEGYFTHLAGRLTWNSYVRYQARLVDGDEESFKEWGIWSAGTTNAASIASFVSAGMSAYSIDVNSNDLTKNNVLTTVEQVSLASRNVGIRGVTDSRYASISANTTLSDISTSLLTSAHKSALSSDTNFYDVNALLNGRQSSTWTVTCASGYAVTGWYNAADDSPITSDNYYTVSSDGRSLTVSTDAPDTDVYALVQKESGILTATSNEGGTFVLAKEGTVTEAPFAVALGDTVGIMLSPEWNYVVSSVTVNGVAQEITDNVVEFTVGYGDVAVAVTFVKRARRSFTVTCVGLTDGSVSLSRDGSVIASSEDGVLSASIYDSVEYDISASPKLAPDGLAAVKKFVGWYSDAECTQLVSADAAAHVTLEADGTLWAKFADADSYSVSASAVDASGNAVAGCSVSFSPNAPDFAATGKFATGRTMTFTAAAGVGWGLYGWRVGSGPIDTTAGDSFAATIGSENLSVSAVFTKQVCAFTASFASASQGKDGVSFYRQRYSGGSWTTLLDSDEILYGDHVRLVVSCGTSGFVLHSATANETDYAITSSGSSFYVEIPSIAGNVVLTLVLAGTLKVVLHCDRESGDPVDDVAEVAILDETGNTVLASTRNDDASVSVSVPLGETRYIRATKVTDDVNFGFDGWYMVEAAAVSLMSAVPPGATPMQGYEPKSAIKQTSASQEYHAGFSNGDKTHYVKIRNATGTPYFGTLSVAGGTVITAEEYAAGKSNGFSADGDPVGTIYLKFTSPDVVMVSVVPGDGNAFNQWTLRRVTADPQGGHEPTISSNAQNVQGESFTYYVTSDLLVEATYKDDSTRRWLYVYGADDVSFSPAGYAQSHTSAPMFASQHYQGDVVEVSVSAPSGKVFAGLYEDSSFTIPHSGNFVTMGSGDISLFVKFVNDTHGIFAMSGGSANRTLRWRSKMYSATKPWDPKVVQVEADGYDNVKVRVLRASSPDVPSDEEFDSVAPEIAIMDERGRLLPRRRPERHVMVEVESDAAVNSVAVATSVQEITA